MNTVPQFADVLENYAAAVRSGAVKIVRVTQLPFADTDNRKVVTITMDFGEVPEAQVTAG